MPENTNPQDMNKPLNVNHWSIKFIAVIDVVLFMFLAIVGWSYLDWYYYVFLIFIIGAGVFLYIMAGSTEMDDESIVLNTKVGQFKINWVDVKRVETDSYSTFVFIGENKQLVIPHRLFWSGKDKKQMRALMDEQIKKREIQFVNSPWASYKLPKNTKIKE